MLGLTFFGISGAIIIGLALLVAAGFIEAYALLLGKLRVAGGAIVDFLRRAGATTTV